jgi:uncharacterized protein (UPF0303 family)
MIDEKDLESRIRQCIQEEEELQFRTFTNRDALELGLNILKRAEEENKSITIDIERHGQRLFHYAMYGTSMDNDQWVERKKCVVNRVFKSSYHFFLWLEHRGQNLRDRGLDEKEYAATGGAFPLTIRDAGVIGTIAVSGLPHEEDHALVVSEIRNFLSRG